MRDFIQMILYVILIAFLAISLAYVIANVYVSLTEKECIEGYIWSTQLNACIPGYRP
jgi:hypothetical protein